MTKNNYADAVYFVNGVGNFNLGTALRLWKTKYNSDYKEFVKEVILNENLNDFAEFVKECWDDITLVTIEEALKIKNIEERRTYFDSIGIEELFKKFEPILKDKQVIKKKRTRWDDKSDPYTYEFEDVYELYQIDSSKLFEFDSWNRPITSGSEFIYAVRCWCTTTNREYWIYVNREAATGQPWSRGNDVYDAIRAIAWTIRIDITHPSKIYRQGDIIVAKFSEKSEMSNPYHLNKEQYLELMYSET
jgi:hypothetical protein